MLTVFEPQCPIPVRYEADLCVAGGSCTGVFAAVRAARMGLKVVLLERTNMFGGMATGGLVNIWHSLKNTSHDRQIIAGLTSEVLERLDRRNAVDHAEDDGVAHTFNPAELALELDNLVRENRITPVLHTQVGGVLTDGNRITHIFIQNKDGRSAVKADFFIDCTGDGDLCRDLGIASFRNPTVQPPTGCYLLKGLDSIDDTRLCQLVNRHGEEFGLDRDWGWSSRIPRSGDVTMRADRHVLGVLCDRADDLTFAEMDSRRQMDACVKMFRKYGPQDAEILPVALCGQIGIRDSIHYETACRAEGLQLLTGARSEECVLRGTYRGDIHQKDGSIRFRYLSGDEEMITLEGEHTRTGNWREKMGLTGDPATWYELSFRTLVPKDFSNFIAAGRMLNADEWGFGALRVMVNLNQLGEAAGTAAALCLAEHRDVRELEGKKVRQALIRGGSALE